jgi:two-component system, chemotaxis family, protein-glutamate methylesterase/glutaminase
MIRVLIADDSACVRAYLAHLLEKAGMAVAGQAANGEEAVRLAAELSPSVITMDVDMPVLDGLQATKRIMETAPAPIVIVSAHYDKSQIRKTFAAIEAGALAIMEKPKALDNTRCDECARELVHTVELMAKVRPNRRPKPARPEVLDEAARVRVSGKGRTVRLAAIGASTGGPQALKAMFTRLSPDLGVPVVAVQHMTPGFLPGMIDWLAGDCALPISLASPGKPALPGHVYFAPDGYHLEIDAAPRLHLVKAGREHGAMPSVSRLFRSVIQAFGRESLAVLLSGMGADGAAELKRLADLGASAVVQREDTCTVFGMPGQAQRLGAQAVALSPLGIAELLNTLPRLGKGA